MDGKKFADGDVIYIIIDDVDLNDCDIIKYLIEEVKVNECEVQSNGDVEYDGIYYQPYATKKEAFDALIKDTLKQLDKAKERVIECRDCYEKEIK